MLEKEEGGQIAVEARAGGVLDALDDAPRPLDLEGLDCGGAGAVDETPRRTLPRRDPRCPPPFGPRDVGEADDAFPGKRFSSRRRFRVAQIGDDRDVRTRRRAGPRSDAENRADSKPPTGTTVQREIEGSAAPALEMGTERGEKDVVGRAFDEQGVGGGRKGVDELGSQRRLQGKPGIPGMVEERVADARARRPSAISPRYVRSRARSLPP